MPLAALVRRIEKSFPIGGPCGPRLPRRLFVPHCVWRGACGEATPPNVSRAVDRFRIADVDKFLAVRRPAGTDFVIERTVIVACNAASAFGPRRLSGQPIRSHIANKNMKVSRPEGGHPGNPFPIGSPVRLDVGRLVVRKYH